MPASLDGLYFMKFMETNNDVTNISIGQFLGFVSPNFLLVQYFCTEDYVAFPNQRIVGIPHFEDAMIFQTKSELTEKFEFSTEDEEESQ